METVHGSGPNVLALSVISAPVGGCYTRLALEHQTNFTSHRHPTSCALPRTGYYMLYFTCHTEAVRLAEHLRGTRKSERKAKRCGPWAAGS